MATNLGKTTEDLPYVKQTGACDCDLVPDGSMKGYSILFINMTERFKKVGMFFRKEETVQRDRYYSHAITALERKGFEVIYSGQIPRNLDRVLKTVSQVWIFGSEKTNNITPEQINLLKNFYEEGHGLLLLGGDAPTRQEPNDVARAIFGTTMEGYYGAGTMLGIQASAGQPGIVKDHLIATGIDSFYEGASVAHVVNMSSRLKPFMYGRDGALIAAYADEQDRRCILDGGYTRFWNSYSTWGKTSRYIVNVAAWLTNLERFGYKREL